MKSEDFTVWLKSLKIEDFAGFKLKDWKLKKNLGWYKFDDPKS